MLSSIQSFKVIIRSVLMVHHGLDYTHTWHLLREIVCFKRGGFWPVTHPNYMYDYLKQWWNQETLWIRLILAILFGTQHTWYGRGIISNNFATCAFWAILCLFYCSPPPTRSIWQMFQILLVYYDHMHVWKVSGCWNQILFSLLW